MLPSARCSSMSLVVTALLSFCFCRVDQISAGMVPRPYLSAQKSSLATHCQFQGIIPLFEGGVSEPVVFHIFLRAVAVKGHRLLVKGFSYLLPAAHVRIRYMSAQEAQSPAYLDYRGNLRLISVKTNRSIVLQSVPAKAAEQANAISGDTRLSPEDAAAGELSLLADGFAYKCQIMLEEMDNPRRSGFDTGGPKGASGMTHIISPRIVHFNGSVLYASGNGYEAKSDGTRLDGASGSERSKSKRADVDEPSGTGVVWVLTPMFSMDAKIIETMFKYHWAWHRKFGITQYVLYVLGNMGDLTSRPIIKEMVNEGSLKLVLWDVFATHLPDPSPMSERKPNFEGYAHQNFVSNHAILEHWLQDVYIVSADLDEWLLTPKPMTVLQVLAECSMSGQRLAGLNIEVLPVRCLKCSQNGKRAELPSWRELLLNMTGDGTLQESMYPLTLYTQGKSVGSLHGEKVWMPRKAIIDPNYIQTGRVHSHVAMQLARYVQLESIECVRFGHMTQLYHPRKAMYGRNCSDDFREVETDPKWMWPATMHDERDSRSSNTESYL